MMTRSSSQSLMKEGEKQRNRGPEDDEEEGALPMTSPRSSITYEVPRHDETSMIATTADLPTIEYQSINLHPSVSNTVDVDSLIINDANGNDNGDQDTGKTTSAAANHTKNPDPAATPSLTTSTTISSSSSDADKAAQIARQDWQAKFGRGTKNKDNHALVSTSNPHVSHNSVTMSMPATKQELIEADTEAFKTIAMENTQPLPHANNHSEPMVPPGAVSVTGTNTVQQLYPVQHSTSTVPEDTTNEDNNRATATDVENQAPTQQETLLEATLVVDPPTNNINDNPHTASATEAKLVQAEALVCGFSKQQLVYLGTCLCCLVVAVVVATTLLVVERTDDNNIPTTTSTVAPTPTPRPTLEQIRDRNVLRCGVWKEALDFFNLVGAYGDNGAQDQVDHVLCEAYAAAILGDASLHEIVLTTQTNNLQFLQNGTIDILLSHVETGMQADVWESENGVNAGFTFSVPYVYTDLVYGGIPHYVACADDDMNARGNCSELSICTNDKSAYFEAIASKLPESHLVKLNDTIGIVLGFINGECNVLPSENSGIMEWGLALLGHRGDYVRGTVPFAKDVVTVATRDDDAEFSDVINIVLLGLFAAEANNITKETSDLLLQSANVFGNELAQAVSAVGSYKDVYERGIAPIMDRAVWNLINNGSTGLLYTLPLGKVGNDGPGPVPGGTLDQIWKRADRKLHCGVRMDRPGFCQRNSAGEPVGMDVDFCTALAASVLEGEAQSIEFVQVSDETDGYRMLQNGDVDVVAGFEWNVVNDYREATTGEGYSFSQPYFYSPVGDQSAAFNSSLLAEDGDNRCLVTRQDDPQFSSFVYWVVAAIVYAEEQGITQARANDMMDVNLFGDNFSKMFRDAIYFAGSYSEIYERHLAGFFPERGRNAINVVEDPGPQIYVPPGFF